MKYVTKTNIELYDLLIKKYIDTELNSNVEDLLTYGIEWEDSASPQVKRIGNLDFHKSLPILSKLKGCIAQGEKIMYWLNEDDWRFRKDTNGFVLKSQKMGNQLTDPSVIENEEDPSSPIIKFSFVNDLFSDQRYKNLYIRLKSEVDENAKWWPIKIISIDSETKTATCQGIFPKDAALNALFTLEIGSVLNGYDGVVRIYSPTFYIKSSSNNGLNKVLISETKLDETWYELKEILIDAYRCTLLREVPENFGYLSTLPINSIISVCNTETYCRGCNNTASRDSYLETDIYRTDLGKSASSLTPQTVNSLTKNTNSYEISYSQYKNIIYWLWVIEYGTFNARLNFNPNLTDDGYKLGGLGQGFTGLTSTILNYYNTNLPLVPCGLLNEFGNNTGSKTISLTIPTTSDESETKTISVTLVRWRGFDCLFLDSYTWLNGINGKFYKDHIDIYQTDNLSLDLSLTDNKNYLGRIDAVLKLVLKYKLGDKADVICDTSAGFATNINYGMNSLISTKVADTTNENIVNLYFAAGGYNSSDLSSIMSMLIAYSFTYANYLIGSRTISYIN